MDLIIVDENITYARTLREFCSKSSDFKNVLIFRTLKELHDTFLPKKGILLFELNEKNKNYLNSFNAISSNLIMVALTNEQELRKVETAHRISSYISKSEKLEEILEQLILIIKGKRIIPQKMFETMNETENLNNKNKAKKSLTSVLSKIFL